MDNMKWKKIIIKDKFQTENGTVHNIQRLGQPLPYLPVCRNDGAQRQLCDPPQKLPASGVLRQGAGEAGHRHV